MIQFDHKSFLKTLTSRPGVYQMYDDEGKLLYVGKAKNLKNRVGSYFRARGLTDRTVSLVGKIRDIQVTVTIICKDRHTICTLFVTNDWCVVNIDYLEGNCLASS